MAVQVRITLDKERVEEKHQTILEKARVLLEKVIAHRSFRSEIEGAQYSGGTLFRTKDGKIQRKNSVDVGNIIIAGKERYEAEPGNGTLDMIIKPYPHRRGVVGSAGLGRQPIKPALWFLERCANRGDAISLARHLIHEWLHVAGFFHPRSGPNQDDVPYQVGEIVRKLAKTLPKTEKGLWDDLEGYLQEDDFVSYLYEEAEDDIDFPEEWDKPDPDTWDVITDEDAALPSLSDG